MVHVTTVIIEVFSEGEVGDWNANNGGERPRRPDIRI